MNCAKKTAGGDHCIAQMIIMWVIMDNLNNEVMRMMAKRMSDTLHLQNIARNIHGPPRTPPVTVTQPLAMDLSVQISLIDKAFMEGLKAKKRSMETFVEKIFWKVCGEPVGKVTRMVWPGGHGSA